MNCDDFRSAFHQNLILRTLDSDSIPEDLWDAPEFLKFFAASGVGSGPGLGGPGNVGTREAISNWLPSLCHRGPPRRRSTSSHQQVCAGAGRKA